MPNTRRGPRHERVFSITTSLCGLLSVELSTNTTHLACRYESVVHGRPVKTTGVARNNNACYVATCVCGVAVWIRLVRVYCRNSTETANGNPPFSQFVRNSAGTSYLPLNMILWRKRDRGQMQLCCYATAYRDTSRAEKGTHCWRRDSLNYSRATQTNPKTRWILLFPPQTNLLQTL